MNTVQMAVPKDAPVMKAWEAHKATEEFANTLKWAGEANLGQLWACFCAGYYTKADNSVTSEIVEIMNTYDQQQALGCVDTPGGLEHMGDVWALLDTWRDQINACSTIK